MSEDYLWDRTGPPDPEIERLERMLAPLRYRHVGRTFRLPRVWWAAAAAVVLAAVGVSQFAVPSSHDTAWQVTSLEGAARLGSRAAAVSMPVRAGQVLRTGRASQLTLQAAELGKIDIGPDTELRAATDRKVLLQRGTLHAFIWAPPRQFVVDTPSARAVDLGCEYTITMDGSGNGLLRVAMGWVAFQFADRESFIPAGAACVTRQREGPGIPFYEDAPFRAELAAFERGESAALGRILTAARPRDALTLWHLLARVPPRNRGVVFDRFAQLVSLPPEVSRDGVLRTDRRAIDLCWNALNLENTAWWRGWERPWQ
jgi:hypothetical protein